MKKILVTAVLFLTALHAESIYATFDVEAEKAAELSLTSSGTIEGINIDVGSRVKKGDILLWLDNDDMKEAVELAKAQLELARVDAKFAQRNFERYEKVKNVIDAGEYDRYASAYETAKSRLHEAEVNVRYKQALLEKTILRAPFDGVVSDKPVEVGDVVSGAMIKVLLRLQSAKANTLKLKVDQKYWTKLKAGQTFRYRVDGETAPREGKVSIVYPTANNANRKIIVEVPAKGIVPGLFGEGEIEAD
ncbi:efflux RND transporter periplasmic adaptor subunit [Sulfurimonas sp. HSL1-2]|jgi:RND family efflux transporter MFP subunit|uniref:efflux RND transporter periplasmic adaptor subunit n=1 Tax=Thiomicrolovo zhangzhouensis TaxID=3131933 RepID=UPI0031FA16C3